MSNPTASTAYVPLTGIRRIAASTMWTARNEGMISASVAIIVTGLSKFGFKSSGSTWYKRLRSAAFDKRFCVATADSLAVDQLDVAAERRQHAVEYDPTPSAALSLALSALQIDFRRFAFIDLGSGKGRALIMAAQFPFGEIIGVEFSAKLHETAVRNIETCCRLDRRRSVTLLCLDATKFDFPVRPLVVYLFNPFDEAILTPVLARLERTLHADPREVVVIYHNPVHRRLFDEASFLRLCPSRGDVETAIYEYCSPAAPSV